MKLLLALLLISSSAFAYSPFFVENEGQWDAPFAFKSEIGNATYFITSSGLTIDLREPSSAVILDTDRVFEDQPVLDTRSGVTGSRISRASRVPAEADPPICPKSVRGHVLKLNLVNANPAPKIIGEDKLSSYSNYFLGRDSCQWRSRVPHYQRVVMKEVWPGIDVELVAQEEGVETVYHVAPYADPSQIQIEVEGLSSPLSVDANGSLLLPTSLGNLREQAPYAYQKDARIQKSVSSRYHVLSASRYTLTVSGYDHQKEVVIDPLLYGSYWGGGGGDDIQTIRMGTDGRLVVMGETTSHDFPTTPGAWHESWPGGYSAFATVLSPDADSVVFSTFVGGGTEATWTGAVSWDGTVWMAGATAYAQWPLTPDAFDTTFGGGGNGLEGWLIRLSAGGDSLLYSSYLGGYYNDIIWDLALDNLGRVYVTGETYASTDFPITANAPFPIPDPTPCTNGFLTVFDPTSSQLSLSTFIPSNHFTQPWKLTLVGPGRVWVSGSTEGSNFPTTPNALQLSNSAPGVPDGFFTLWDTDDGTLLYGSYLGGSARDGVSALAVLDSSTIVLAGWSGSFDFPVTPGVVDTVPTLQDAFVTVLQLPATVTHSTFVGGSGDFEHADGVAADSTGIVVAGRTTSYDFPVTPGAFDTLYNGSGQPDPNSDDAFVTKISFDLSHLLYSTFLGGSGVDHLYAATFTERDSVWLGGDTGSPDLPVTDNAVQSSYHGWGDGFLLKFAIPPVIDAVPEPFIPHPSSLILSVYPNPFNPSTTVSFSLPRRERVSLQVFDLLGRQVQTLNWGMMEAGNYQRAFNANLPSGMYVMRLNAGTQAVTNKMVMIR